jgi:hypothetical protein
MVLMPEHSGNYEAADRGRAPRRVDAKGDFSKYATRDRVMPSDAHAVVVS